MIKFNKFVRSLRGRSKKDEDMKPVTAVVLGAGNRGNNYSYYAQQYPQKLKIVGVGEPRDITREQFQKAHALPSERVYSSWQDVAKEEKFADCVFITTQDRMHKEPAVAMANKGYHVLLEKPMAVTYADCKEIVEACKKNKVMLQVCHVLRYSPQAIRIKQLIDSGIIGDIMNIQHLEPIGFWHTAHSYVRGNWRNEAESSPSLLAKCCHDLDLIQYWMGDRKCERISSFGSLKHFKPENKPKGASSRCLDCSVEESCPYSAKKIYLDRAERGYKGWPLTAVCEVTDVENVAEALKSGPYGRCVYDCDNDVMDNQVVTMQYEGGATCTMSMVGCTEKTCGRQVRVFGSMGELACDFTGTIIREYNFLTKKIIHHDVMEDLAKNVDAVLSGHGGADYFAMETFVHAVATNDPSKIPTGPEDSLRSHHLCFAAEQARKTNSVVQL